MNYRSVGERCAVNFAELDLPISEDEAIAILDDMHFKIITTDLSELARAQVGKKQYRRGARMYEAPEVFDCSSLMKWLYGNVGIWLPRRSIQQRELGESIPLADVAAGDIIFVSGRIDYYREDPRDGVGHVGIVSERGTVIHAANSRRGVAEDPLGVFLRDGKFRGARRYLTDETKIVSCPPDWEVETSDDLRWIILQNL